MSRPAVIAALGPGDPEPGGRGAHHPVARSGQELLSRLPEQADPEGLVLIGDRWLHWPDRRTLAPALAAWRGSAPLSLVVTGRAFRAHEAVSAARELGVSRVTVEIPSHWFHPGSDPGRIGQCLEGASRLCGAGIPVRVCLAVDKYSRGLLDELAVEAARTGAVAFEPVPAPSRPDFVRLAGAARDRFLRIRASRWPARADLLLQPQRALDFDPVHCAWRSRGWPGPEPAHASAVLCPPEGAPVLYAALETALLPAAEVALRRHAFGQVYWLRAGAAKPEPLVAHPACNGCLRRLQCPTAYVVPAPPTDATLGPPPLPVPTPRQGTAVLAAGLGPKTLRAAFSGMAPGEHRIVTGRSGRLLLQEEPTCLPAAQPAGAPPSRLPLDPDIADPHPFPPDPDIADPQWVADLAHATGCQVGRYSLPGPSSTDSWWLEIRRPERPPARGLRPNQALLMLCNVCVTRCLMCGLPDLFDRAFLPAPHALRWLAELRLLGMARVDLFGGEVTLRTDLLDLAEFARHRGIRTSFITTGYRLDEAFRSRLLQSAVDQVEVALDHPERQGHNHIKGGLDAFEDAVRLMEAVGQDRGRVLDVNSVILRENLGRLPEVLSLAAELGADEYRLFSCIRFPLAPGLQEPLTLDDAAQIWEQDVPGLRRMAEARGIGFEVAGAVLPQDPDRDAAYAAFVAGTPNPLPRLGIPCTAPRTELSLLIDGTVLPCQNPSFYADLLSRPGNGLRQWIWQVVASEPFQDLAAAAGTLESCGRCIAYRTDRLAPSAVPFHAKTRKPQ